jgi:hypothetical protein
MKQRTQSILVLVVATIILYALVAWLFDDSLPDQPSCDPNKGECQ